MASFLDYYEDELRKRRSPAPATSPQRGGGVPLSSLKAADDGEPEGVFSPTNPIGWTLDMLSRPLYGMNQANAQNAEKLATGAGKLQRGDILGGAADIIASTPSVPDALGPFSGGLNLIKQLFGNNTNQAFAEGLTTNDPEKKLTGSDLLEQGFDRIQQETNPEYQNTENNVPALAKGIEGLALDIGGDPLTYLPGAAIAGAGSKIAQALKGGTAGIKAALTGAKEAPEVAETVKVATKAEPEAAVVDNVFEDATSIAPTSIRQEPALDDFLKEPGSWVDEELDAARAPEVVPDNPFKLPNFLVGRMPKQPTADPKMIEAAVEGASTGAKLAEVIKSSPKIPGIRKELKDLFTALTKDPEGVPARDVQAFSADVKPFDRKAWFEDADNMIETRLPGDDASRFYTYGELDQIVQKERGKTPRGDAAFQLVRQGLRDAEAAHADAGSQAILTGVDAYHKRLVTGGAALRNILGEELTDMLLSKRSATSAQRLLIKLESLFSGKLRDPEGFLAANPKIQEAIVPTFKGETDAVKSVPNTPEKVAEAAEMVELSPVSKALSAVFRQENLPGTPEFVAKYGEIARTNPVAKSPEDATADWWRRTNTFTQYGLYKKLQTYISDRIQSVKGLPREKLYGPERAAANRQAVEELGGEITDSMETFGTPLHIGVKDDLVRLTFPQVYELVGRQMDELFGNADVTNLALYNFGTSVAFTRLLNVTQQAIVDPSLTADDLAKLIRATGKDSLGANAAEKLPNNITATGSTKGTGAGRAYRYPGNSQKQAKLISDAVGGKMVRQTDGVWVLMNKGGNLPEMLAEAIHGARPALLALSDKNAADWAARGIAEAQQLAGQELAALRRLATNESKAAARQVAQATARRKSDIGKQAAAIAATPEGTQAAVLATDASLGDDVIKNSEILTRQESRIKDGAELEDAGTQAMGERYDAAELGNWAEMLNSPAMEPVLTKVLPTDTIEQAVKKFDIGEQANAKIQETVNGFLDFLGHHFNRNFGIKENPDLLLKASNAAGRFVAKAITGPVKKLAATFDRETLTQGLRAVQQGTRLDPQSELGRAALGIESIIGKIFDLDSTSMSAMGNVFLESGAKLAHINDALKWAFGGQTSVQFYRAEAQRAARAALSEGGAKFTKAQLKARTEYELREQWRNWDLGDDPANAIEKLGQAAGRVAEHQAIVTSFLKEGKKYGWAVQVPKGGKVPEGFVKVVDSSGRSSFASLLPKGTYIQKELASELARMDYLTTVSRQLSGEAGDFVRGTLVPVTNTWKQGMTIYRPGHHVRNFIGNLSLQYVDRGPRAMKESSKAALKLMGMRNDFEGLDAIAALRSMGDEVIPRNGDVLFSTKTLGDFTVDEMWSILNREGLLPTYAASEGLLTGEVRQNSTIARLLKPLDADNNPVGRLGAAASQNLDHAQRMHHLIQALMQEGSAWGGKWSGLPREAIIKKAAAEVRRLHPDSSMLTATENKYLKLLIPFYTWMRGVLPGAIESSLQHPGRLMQFPKASYNLAVATGVNPDSISDPFPEDQLFPSFIHEAALGPQFKIGDNYIRVNPGIAQFDLAESLATDPVRGVAGMINPVFRAPAELLAGGSWSTGGRINDTSDYVDQNVPFVNFLSNISGTSLTGSIPSLFEGQGLDPQAQVARGNKGELDQALALWNLLTGTQTTNLSRPNFINYAEIEKRNAEGGK